MNNRIVNAKSLAEVLGITEQYVNKLAKIGVLEKHGRGKFPLESNITKFVEYQKASEGPKTQNWKESYWQEKAKHERALRQIAEIKVGEAQGKLHEASRIEHVMTNMLITFRNKLLGVPYKIANVLVGVETADEALQALRKEMCEALDELKSYDPTMFAGQEEALD